MKSIDKIISKSLSLINYDRGKPLNEQSVASPKPGFDDFVKYLRDGRIGEETSYSPEYLTTKSVVNNKNIYLPEKKVTYTPPPFRYDKFTGNFNVPAPYVPSVGDYKKALISRTKFSLDDIKKTASLTSDLSPTTTKPVNTNSYKILKTVSSSEGYNPEVAEQYFGSQCLKLSGRHPKYEVGYNKDLDYFMDDSGTQCFPKPYSVIQDKILKSEVKVLQKDLTKPAKLKNGKNIQKSKFQYDKKCKPISYEACLRFSWENLYSIGSQEQGVLEFEETVTSTNKQTQKITYRGCVTDEWFPWLNKFVGYLVKTSEGPDINKIGNKPKIQVYTDSSGVKQITKCTRKGESDTGVNIIEKYLTTTGSGQMTVNFVPYENVLNFTLDEVVKTTTGADMKIQGNYTNYQIWLKQWFSFGDADKKTYKTDVNTSFYDYLKRSQNEEDPMDDYLNDLYGSNLGLSGNQTNLRVGVGIDFIEETINETKTLNALQEKYTEIREKNPNKWVDYLIILSKDYNAESKKPVPNKIVTSFLEVEWNNTIGLTTQISLDYSPNKNGYKDINAYIISYCSEKFGLVNQLLFWKNQKTEQRAPFASNFTKGIPLLIPTDYNDYNTKKIKPVTIKDAESRAKTDGENNGYLYISQTIDGVESAGVNDFKLSNLMGIGTNKQSDMTEEQVARTMVELYKKYDSMIGEVMKSTIVIMGK